MTGVSVPYGLCHVIRIHSAQSRPLARGSVYLSNESLGILTISGWLAAIHSAKNFQSCVSIFIPTSRTCTSARPTSYTYQIFNIQSRRISRESNSAGFPRTRTPDEPKVQCSTGLRCPGRNCRMSTRQYRPSRMVHEALTKELTRKTPFCEYI